MATSLNNLAVLYRAQGRYAEAEPLYKRSLAIDEKALGPEHPDVGTALNNLAGLYQAQGRYAEAEPLVQRSLAIREKALGPEHPDVATSLNNLAALYRDQGRYAEAEPLYRRSLAIDEKALGPEHPDVASTQQPGRAVPGQGRYAEAEPLYKRACHPPRRRWGPTTPTWDSLNNLAGCTGPKAATPRPSRSTSAPRHRGEGAGARPPRRGDLAQQPGLAVPRQRPIRGGRWRKTSASLVRAVFLRWNGGRRRTC